MTLARRRLPAPPRPIVPGPNRMCLESKDRCWVHPRAHLTASHRRRPRPLTDSCIRCVRNNVHNVQLPCHPAAITSPHHYHRSSARLSHICSHPTSETLIIRVIEWRLYVRRFSIYIRATT